MESEGNFLQAKAIKQTTTVWRLLDREYRRLATGMCFLIFMVSGLVGSLLVLPVIRLLPVTRRRKDDLSLDFVQRGFGAFTRMMVIFRVIRFIEVTGLENLRDGGPFLFIANHPTLIDVVVMMGLVPRCNCIVKKELFHHPFMAGVARGTGLLPNDAGVTLLARIESEIGRGRSLMVFPEGTRSPMGGLHPFNRGAARIALHTGIRVAPVIVTCEPSTLRKGQAWYEVPDRPMEIRVRFLEPLPIEKQSSDAGERPKQVRALTRGLEQRIKKELGFPE